jgi:hypothetical protein
MKLKCAVCEFTFKGDEGCLSELIEYDDGKKEANFYHQACYKVQEDYKKMRDELEAQGKDEEIPAYYDYCREQGIKLNPKMFEWPKPKRIRFNKERRIKENEPIS